MFRALNQTRGSVLAEHVECAATLWKRMKGLLGRADLPAGHGVWIRPCNSIHTFFMRFPIDAVFISADGSVLRTLEDFPPFRVTFPVWGARAVLELPAGTLKHAPARTGDRLLFEKAI